MPLQNTNTDLICCMFTQEYDPCSNEECFKHGKENSPCRVQKDCESTWGEDLFCDIFGSTGLVMQKIEERIGSSHAS